MTILEILKLKAMHHNIMVIHVLDEVFNVTLLSLDSYINSELGM